MDFLANNLDKCCYSGDMAEELPICTFNPVGASEGVEEGGPIQGEINPPYIKYCINRENWDRSKIIAEQFFQEIKNLIRVFRRFTKY
ncbi:MAG: hypothetical protein MZV63_00820 [Marinilabiliales bacterium]|nr:hypothetical protein [Marinilabiliales bacterium]